MLVKIAASLIKALISLFNRHSRDGRVILPLLKTIDHLLSQGGLDQLLSKNDPFPRILLLKLKIEINRCTDVRRLFAAIGVLVGLVSAEDTVLVSKPIETFHENYNNSETILIYFFSCHLT